MKVLPWLTRNLKNENGTHMFGILFGGSESVFWENILENIMNY